jgi:hypothetical protein
MRTQIMKDTHESLAHCGRNKLITALQTNWWWPSQRTWVADFLRRCPVCQPEKLPPPLREPQRQTNTCEQPCRGWSVDLAGPFQADENGNVYLIVAVDTLTKWCEAGLLPSKHAFRTTEWLYESILCRWGRPVFIRTDNGSEWAG